MIGLRTEARSFYWCLLSKEDEQKVREFMKNEGVSVANAVRELWMRNEIEIYTSSIESDFHTQEIYDVVDYGEEDD